MSIKNFFRYKNREIGIMCEGSEIGIKDELKYYWICMRELLIIIKDRFI